MLTVVVTNGLRVVSAYGKLISDKCRFVVECRILTDIVDRPLVRVLTSLLVVEKRKEHLLADLGVRVQEQRPSGEDDVDGIGVLQGM